MRIQYRIIAPAATPTTPDQLETLTAAHGYAVTVIAPNRKAVELYDVSCARYGVLGSDGDGRDRHASYQLFDKRSCTRVPVVFAVTRNSEIISAHTVNP